jgi:hypothetical protein
MRLALRSSIAAVSLLFAVGVTAACSSDHDRPKAPAKTRPAPKSPAGKASPAAPVALGQKTTVGGTVAAATLQYKQPSVTGGGPPPGPAGYTWGSAEVQVCTLAQAKAKVTVDWKTWSLRYADNSLVAAADANDNAFPRPEYPFASQPLAAGQCVRGWITFAVPANSQPIAVQYQPHGYLAEWTVPPSSAGSPAGSAAPSPSAS